MHPFEAKTSEEWTLPREGAGELSYRALQDGRIFVYDVEDQALESAKRMRAGQKFVLSPEKNIATHDYRRSLSRLPLYRRRRPRLLSAVNSESIRLAARFNSFLVKPYSCNA